MWKIRYYQNWADCESNNINENSKGRDADQAFIQLLTIIMDVIGDVYVYLVTRITQEQIRNII